MAPKWHTHNVLMSVKVYIVWVLCVPQHPGWQMNGKTGEDGGRTGEIVKEGKVGWRKVESRNSEFLSA